MIQFHLNRRLACILCEDYSGKTGKKHDGDKTGTHSLLDTERIALSTITCVTVVIRVFSSRNSSLPQAQSRRLAYPNAEVVGTALSDHRAAFAPQKRGAGHPGLLEQILCGGVSRQATVRFWGRASTGLGAYGAATPVTAAKT